MRLARVAYWVLTRTLATTGDRDRAESSPMMWGQAGDDAENGIWRLRVVGVLNGLLAPHVVVGLLPLAENQEVLHGSDGEAR